MSIIFDEKFEGAEYEESWSESAGAGVTIDPDQAVSAVTGAPGYWGDQCLEIIAVASENAYAAADVSGVVGAITYFRLEVIVNAEGAGDGDDCYIFIVYDSAWGNMFALKFGQQAGGNFRFEFWNDLETNNHTGLADVSLNTVYLIEIEWDTTNNTYEWKVDGVSQASDVLNDNTVPGYVMCGRSDWHDVGFTCFYNNIALDNADWIGPVQPENVSTVNGVDYQSIYKINGHPWWETNAINSVT